MAAKCTYHCRECGQHFVSLTAFDKHITGPIEARECVDAESMGMSGMKGICAIASAKKHKGMIWTTRSLST